MRFSRRVPAPANTIMWHPCVDPGENRAESPWTRFAVDQLDATAAIREWTNKVAQKTARDKAL